MRQSLFDVIKELEGFDEASRVKEAGMLQDELREAMALVSSIRRGAAEAAVAEHGLAGAAVLADSSQHSLRVLAEGLAT